jgi:hypothetical protein
VRIVTRLCLVLSLLGLAACAGQQPYADDATITSVSYRDSGPSTITLYTMVNNRTGAGGHSALMISASERIIFDPAGSFYADVVPERNDVLFGITPGIEQAYRSSHARSTFHVQYQTIEVSAAQAEVAYRLALQNGSVPGAFCANATSTLLSRVPGFEEINVTFYPTKLAEQFGAIPGVKTEKYYENDSEDLDLALAEGNRKLNTE